MANFSLTSRDKTSEGFIVSAPSNISRRSWEHRPTIGVLEPRQVTPMCLLGASRWHSWRNGYPAKEPARLAGPGEAAARTVVQL